MKDFQHAVRCPFVTCVLVCSDDVQLVLHVGHDVCSFIEFVLDEVGFFNSRLDTREERVHQSSWLL